MRTTLHTAMAISLSAGLAASAAAQVRVIYSNFQASPTSDVPGMPGVKFMTGTATQFDRPFLSPDGNRWIFVANTNLPAAENEVVIIGGGATNATATGQIVAREGTPTPWDPGINYGIMNTSAGINNAGFFTFGADTTAPTTMDAVIVAGTAGSLVLVAREGDPAPGQAAGVGYGSTSNASHVLNDNTVCFRSAALSGATTQQVLYRGTEIVAQTDLTAPAGQLVAPGQTLDNLTSDRYRTDPTGAHSIYHADLNGPTTTDLVMVVDGSVFAQEGVALPNSGFLSNVTTYSADAGSQSVGSDGGFIFRGGNADTIDWVVRNGAVVAATDQPITPGSAELFDDAPFAPTFFISTCNNVGDYIIGGTTNAADGAANAVLVLNGTTVVVRENDPVDVDGNGQFDDNAFVSVFNNDDCVLTDGLVYYFNADLRDSSGASIGQAFLSVDLGGDLCAADFNGDGNLDPDDLSDFITCFFTQASFPGSCLEADFNSDANIDPDDLSDYITAFFNGC